MKKTPQKQHVLIRIFNKKPGQRFLYAYIKINKRINKSLLIKLLFLLLGMSSILFGIILLFIPGPGSIFIMLGAVLLCAASKRIALWLDKIEKKTQGEH